MVKENITTQTTAEFDTGDLVEVVLKDGQKFKGLVVENYVGGFTCKVLNKESSLGTAIWERYGSERDHRFQVLEDCSQVKVLSKSRVSKASGTFSLNESVSKNEMTYYETDLGDGKYATLCLCEGYGGWSFYDSEEDHADSLKESYFNSQISKYNSREIRG